MKRKILVPIDGSAVSEAAIRECKALLAGSPESRVLVLRVLELPPNSPHFDPADLEVARQKERRQAGLDLDTMKEEYGTQDFQVETRLVEAKGDVGETIAAQAELEQVDLIALTTHGRTGLKKLFLGSVAEKVVKLAPCSVLIVKT